MFDLIPSGMSRRHFMTHLAGADDSDQDLDHYAGLAKENPFLATVLAVGLGSLAGIPPLAGFMGKFLVFVAVFKAGHGTCPTSTLTIASAPSSKPMK